MDSEKVKVLIVEDDLVSLKLLVSCCQDEYEIFIAQTGEQALDYIDPSFSLVLLDLGLPDMSGLELMQALRQRSELKDLSIIVCTGNIQEDVIDRAFALGAHDYLVKPYIPSVIQHNMRQVISARETIRQLSQLSLTDPLTQLNNRRALNERLDMEWQRHRREDSPLSMLLIDIDFFKRINDEYGHDVGDRCLVEIARVTSNIFSRSSDFVARMGGEEFLALLPNTPAAGANHAANRLCQTIEKHFSEHRELPALTVSVGVATVVPDNAMVSTDLYKVADEQLYRAKTSGRNSVFCYAMAAN